MEGEIRAVLSQTLDNFLREFFYMGSEPQSTEIHFTAQLLNPQKQSIVGQAGISSIEMHNFILLNQRKNLQDRTFQSLVVKYRKHSKVVPSRFLPDHGSRKG